MLIGIIGKPSAGKSTFLNAACLTSAKTANYPFTTIKPNPGTSYLRVDCVCQELNIIDQPKNSLCIDHQRLIPVKLLDVAGLVPDAHTGKGMGNSFLSDLSRADVLIHVIDISGSLDAEGQDIKEGERDPYDDIVFLEKEINYWFRDIIIGKDWSKFVRKISQEKLNFAEMLYERVSGISVKKSHIILTINSLPLNFEHVEDWTDSEILQFAIKLREISKPILVAANKIDKLNGSLQFEKLKKKYDKTIIPCSALAEFWLRKYEEKGIINYLSGNSKFDIISSDNVIEKEINVLIDIQQKILDIFNNTGIQNVINYAVLTLLNQIVVYPVYDLQNYSDKDGTVLPDAHIVPNGIKLIDFVNDKIHSDLAKNFIYGINGRTKMRLGENYELHHNDIIRIVSAAKPK